MCIQTCKVRQIGVAYPDPQTKETTMPEFYYSATEMGRQAGFPSPASWTRMREAMPTPDCVMVSKAPAAG